MKFSIEKVRENIVMQKYKRKNKKIKKIEAESIDKINFLWRWRRLAQQISLVTVAGKVDLPPTIVGFCKLL